MTITPTTPAVPAKDVPRIAPIDPSRTSGKARELLDEFAERGGTPGPTVLAMATAPALLRGDAKTAALVAFGQQVVAGPSEVSDEQIDELRAFGYRDEQIGEVVGLVSLQLLTGGFNLVAGIRSTSTARSVV